MGRAAHRDGVGAGRALRRRGRRVPDPRPQRVRRPHRSAAWVLAIGAARYVFLAAGWLLPWMRAPLPPRYWRKVVAATQGITLTVAAADVLPLAADPGRPRRRARPARRVVRPRRVVAVAPPARHAAAVRRRLRTTDHAPESAAHAAACGRGLAVVLTVLALLLVWAALVAPDQPSASRRARSCGSRSRASSSSRWRSSCPPHARRLLAWVVGPVLGLLLLVKVLDIGFFTAFDRPFNPVDDWSYTGIGIETLRDSIGRTQREPGRGRRRGARRRRARAARRWRCCA